MTKITLKNHRVFDASTREVLLDAAKRNGIVLEHSCRIGRCGACKAKVVSGDTQVIRIEHGLEIEDVDDGYILTCCRAAKSDLVIDIADVDRLVDTETKMFPCRIDNIEKQTHNVLKVTLRLPFNSNFRYLAGQYINVIGKNGVRRSYSIANAPHENAKLELYIRKVTNGFMSRYWFNEAKINDLLRLEGPLGTFFLRDIKPRRFLLMATGTGIAPIKALLEDIERSAEEFRDKAVYVYWGGRYPEDFYWAPDSKNLNLQFCPVLSRASDAWQGRRGYIQEAVLADTADLSDVVVYVCGSDIMIRAARERLATQGLQPGRFYSDAFVSSS